MSGASGSGSVRPGRSSDEAPDWRRIFVGNIGWWVDEEMLKRVFGEYGTILDAQVRTAGGAGSWVQRGLVASNCTQFFTQLFTMPWCLCVLCAQATTCHGWGTAESLGEGNG